MKLGLAVPLSRPPSISIRVLGESRKNYDAPRPGLMLSIPQRPLAAVVGTSVSDMGLMVLTLGSLLGPAAAAAQARSSTVAPPAATSEHPFSVMSRYVLIRRC